MVGFPKPFLWQALTLSLLLTQNRMTEIELKPLRFGVRFSPSGLLLWLSW